MRNSISPTNNFLQYFNIQIGVSFHPPASLGFQQLYVDAETKFSKEPLHSFITTEIPQGECNFPNLLCSLQKRNLKQKINKEANKKNRCVVRKRAINKVKIRLIIKLSNEKSFLLKLDGLIIYLSIFSHLGIFNCKNID